MQTKGLRANRLTAMFLSVIMMFGIFIPVVTPSVDAANLSFFENAETEVYNMQTDPYLAYLSYSSNYPYLRGVGDSGVLFSVNTSANPKTVTVTRRGGTSHGIQIKPSDLNNTNGQSGFYKIEYTGFFPNNPTAVARIRVENPTGETLATSKAVNGHFTVSVIRTSQQIAADAGAGLRYSLGNESGNIDIVYTSIVITKMPVTVPDTEIKFLLNSDLVLDENGNLLDSVINSLGERGFEYRVPTVADPLKNVKMEYLDTSDKKFDDKGFITRIRRRSWKQNESDPEGYQITYRKRIPLESVDNASIYEAILSAKQQSSSFASWSCEVDWSYDSACLTLDREFSTKKTVSVTSELPGIDGCKEIINKFPYPQGIYSQELQTAFNNFDIYGSDVYYDRYEFSLPQSIEPNIRGYIFRIEVMAMQSADRKTTEYIAEASFKYENSGASSMYKSLDFLSDKRAKIEAELEKEGILLKGNGLKTAKVLERYGPYVQSEIYNMQTDTKLPLFAGNHSESPSTNPLLGSNGGVRTVNMTSNPKEISIVGRGGTSQGIDILLEKLGAEQHYKYKIDVKGKVTTGTAAHSMFIRPVSTANANVGSTFVNSTSATNAEFNLSVTRTYNEIAADIKAGINRYRIGGASEQNLQITGIVITKIPSPDFITIKGAQYSTSLTKLNLSSLGITNADIEPLSRMSKLKMLDLSYNHPLSNLEPLSELKYLQKLYSSENRISDLTPLSGLKNLKTLNLFANYVSDLTPLSNMTGLQTLDLCCNPMRDITPLSGLINLKNLDLSENLNQISNLTPLSGLINLETLSITNGQISSVYPLRTLTNLKSLDLYDNQISDLSPLSGLTNLNRLGFACNEVYSITDLRGLVNLKSLTLDNNHITSLAPLSGLTKLEQLSFHDSLITDITALRGLTNLQALWMGGSVSNIAPISELTNLKRLSFGNKDILSIEPLTKLTKLEWLVFSGTKVSDISPLSGMTNMKYLAIPNNKIVSLAPLSGMTKMEELNMRTNQINNDLTPLYGMTNMQRVYLEGNPLITLTQVNALKSVLPSCSINH
jgi:internalin A